MRKNKITKDTLISKILECPRSKKILLRYNLPCLSCPMATFEMRVLKIGEVCKMYDIDLENLLKELNENIKK